MSTQENESLLRDPVPKNRSGTLKVALTAILTALEAVVTAMIAIPIPGSDGFFNIGEAIIYTTAILFGPFIGGFVGGVGAAIADISLGWAMFAPGTLIIKFCEGAIVGFLFQQIQNSQIIMKQWKTFTLSLGVILGTIMILLGGGNLSITIVGIILMVLIWVLGFSVQKELSQKLLAMIAGALVLVVGYYLYESFVLNIIEPGFYDNPLSAAIIEIPFNSLQALSGILIAIPMIAALEPVAKNYFPSKIQ